MKLAACFNVWSDCLPLLRKAIDNILPCVDHVYVIWSHQSNWGQFIEFNFEYPHAKVSFHHVEPLDGRPPNFNEVVKRNFALEVAKKAGFTHFISMDSDEFYIQSEFLQDKNRVESEDLNGIVHPVRVYFKKPTLYCSDHTLVAGITKLTHNTQVGDYKTFPFAYDEHRNAHIDPTRRPSHTSGVEMSHHYMHHFSWVRDNFDLKIENSTARNNLKRSTIYDDLQRAEPGYYCDFYRDTLKECANIFDL